MKTKILLLFILCLSLTGCSKDDEVGIPEANYPDLQRVAIFYQPGSIIPEVNWNGDKGTFSLLNADPLFTIDQQTGELKWGKLKELNKSYTVTIKAVNSAGEAIQDLNIFNSFSGRFEVESDMGFDTENYRDFEEFYELHPGGVLVHHTISYWKEPFYWEDIYISVGESKVEVGNWEILESGILRINTTDEGSGIVYLLELEYNDATDELWLNGSWYDIKEGEEIPASPAGWAKFKYDSQVRWNR